MVYKIIILKIHSKLTVTLPKILVWIHLNIILSCTNVCVHIVRKLQLECLTSILVSDIIFLTNFIITLNLLYARALRDFTSTRLYESAIKVEWPHSCVQKCDSSLKINICCYLIIWWDIFDKNSNKIHSTETNSNLYPTCFLCIIFLDIFKKVFH